MSKEITLLRRSLFAVLSLAACFVASTAQASTVIVGTCKSGVPQFTTIQAAVTSALAGSTIEICPGTYPEQIKITKKLTLIGEQSGTNDAAVIAAPVGGVVQNATDILAIRSLRKFSSIMQSASPSRNSRWTAAPMDCQALD